jgi:RNA polymerase sigma-70 factor (ECF subfamily)
MNIALTEQFEAHRAHLRRVAYRILGSSTEADDAVQEAWIRLARSDAQEVGNLNGWLTTVVARICLDMLRSRKSRGESPLPADAPERFVSDENIENDVALGDAISIALLVILNTLSPTERVAFVLHDVFNLSFLEIAPIINRSPAAARQLASRARRRIHTSPAPVTEGPSKREILNAFLAAAQGGNLQGLLALLDPSVVMHADTAAMQTVAAHTQGAMTLLPETRGANAVAKLFEGRARVANVALIDGEPGLLFAVEGQVRAVCECVVENGRIVEMALTADRASLDELQKNGLIVP